MKIKQKPLDMTIPNWSMFGAKNIAINIFKKESEGTTYYTSALLIWLNDGSTEEDEELTVTIFTDVVTQDPKQTAFVVAEYASNLFQEISSLVYVFDDDGSVIQEFDLNEEEIPEEISISDDIGEEIKVIH